MDRWNRSYVSRRGLLRTLGAAGAVGLAGCGEDQAGTQTTTEGEQTETEPSSTTDTKTAEPPTTTETAETSEIPPKRDGIREWGERLNEHAKEANIDWQQFADDDITLRFGMGLHPYSTTTRAVNHISRI